MPDIGTLKTAPVVQSAVIGMRASGKSKRSIAKELGIHRKTVDNVLDVMQADVPDYSTIVHKLAGKALSRIDQVIDSDTDTAKWTLEHTLFRPDVPEAYHVHGDVSLVNATTMVPASTSTHSSPSLPSTTSTATEAPAKAGGSDISLSLHTNFSQFSLAELEAEVARRKTKLIEVDAEAPDGAAR